MQMRAIFIFCPQLFRDVLSANSPCNLKCVCTGVLYCTRVKTKVFPRK
jgi:hypothetical protein